MKYRVGVGMTPPPTAVRARRHHALRDELEGHHVVAHQRRRPHHLGETGPLSQGPGLKRVGGHTEYAI
jgi:hypothetical protein